MTGRYLYCTRCGTLWNVSTLSGASAQTYICPNCNRQYRHGIAPTLSKRLMECRLRRGMSGATVAELCGMSRTMLYDYESGKHMPNAEVLAALADFYRVSVDWLMGRG